MSARSFKLGDPPRTVVWISAVLAVGLAVFFAVQLFSRPVSLAPIEKIEFSQYQAVPNFSDTVHVVSDEKRIDEFRALVRQYSIDVRNFDDSLNDDCTGGLATSITLHFTDSTSHKLQIYDCGKPVAGGTFVSDATALFVGWRAADSAP
ncbi:hypothetical protein [Lacisediminihabitans sp.]|uniref:hypothetical protein n=1 Tax=Lacisediminihabitans sp. TaxID=2787631 RepID=UPI00374D9435